MPSQSDLDQGGTFRQYVRRWLGPSVGWVNVPQDNVYPITVAGTYSPLLATTLITVNVNGSVTINLWDPIKPDVPAGALPGDYMSLPVTIVDIGGYANTNPITIVAPAGRNIIGLASIDLTEAYGAFTLLGNLVTGNWNWTQ